MQIKDTVVIVTGASQGIGRATAKLLAAQGAKVVLAARSKEKLEELGKELPGALVIPTDMRNPKEVRALIEKTEKEFGRIDILVNNAGQGMYGPLETIDIDHYKEIMELNVFAVLRAMQEVIPVMRAQGGGMIVNVSSRVSKNYFPHLSAYASTKYALNALTLTARAELAPDHIIVSAFHPKMTATEFAQNAIGTRPDWSARRSSGEVPQIDAPEEVAVGIRDLILNEEAEGSM